MYLCLKIVQVSLKDFCKLKGDTLWVVYRGFGMLGVISNSVLEFFVRPGTSFWILQRWHWGFAFFRIISEIFLALLLSRCNPEGSLSAICFVFFENLLFSADRFYCCMELSFGKVSKQFRASIIERLTETLNKWVYAILFNNYMLLLSGSTSSSAINHVQCFLDVSRLSWPDWKFSFTDAEHKHHEKKTIFICTITKNIKIHLVSLSQYCPFHNNLFSSWIMYLPTFRCTSSFSL